MKKFVVVAFLGLMASWAYAQTPHYLDMFFAPDTTEWGTIPVTAAPTEPAGPVVLPPTTDTWLALWGKSAGSWHQFTTTYKVGPSTKTWIYKDWVGDVWQSVGMNFNDANGILDRVNSYCDNPSTGAAGPSLRWDPASNFGWDSADGGGVGGGFFVASVSNARAMGQLGLDSTAHAASAIPDGEQITSIPNTVLDTPGFLYSIIGFAHVVDPGKSGIKNLYGKVGNGTIGRRNGAPNDDYVKFGIGSAYVLGKTIGAAGAEPMVQITPEPASLVLLALAGLALRRR